MDTDSTAVAESETTASTETNPTETDSILLKKSILAAFIYDRLHKLPFFAPKTSLINHYRELYDDDSANWVRTKKAVLEISSIASSIGADFHVIVIPDFHDLRPSSPYKQIYQKIAHEFSELGLSVENTFPEFSEKFGGKETSVWVASDDVHPNEKGHELMARQLIQAITNL